MPTEEAPRERGGAQIDKGRLLRYWEKDPLCWGREGDIVNGARWFQGEEMSEL